MEHKEVVIDNSHLLPAINLVLEDLEKKKKDYFNEYRYETSTLFSIFYTKRVQTSWIRLESVFMVERAFNKEKERVLNLKDTNNTASLVTSAQSLLEIMHKNIKKINGKCGDMRKLAIRSILVETAILLEGVIAKGKKEVGVA